MERSLFPGYTIGADAYEDIGNVCPAYGTKVAIIGGEKALAAAFPERTLRRAFTSGMILRKLEREGTHIDDVPAALGQRLKSIGDGGGAGGQGQSGRPSFQSSYTPFQDLLRGVSESAVDVSRFL